ncbi:hypothetical protein Tco_1463584 [Tanacetum coccineum]
MLAHAVVDEGEGSSQPTEPQPTPSPTQPSTGDQPPMTESSYRPDTTQDSRVNLEGTGGSQGDHVQIPHDSPFSGGHISDKAEGGLNLDELLTRIKKLEKKWRKNAKQGPTLDAFDDLDADLAHGMDYIETEEAVKEGRQNNKTEELNLDADTEVIKGSGEKGVNTVSTARPDIDTARPEVNTDSAPVSTAGVTISTVGPEVSAVEPRTPPTTTSIFDDEDITMAQTLIKMKEEKAKEKGVAFKDVEDSSTPVRSITTLKPLPSIDPKNKGKGILVEEEHVKIKRKDQGIDQIERDEELAEIERIQEEKAAHEEPSRTTIMEMFDEVQAGIDADALFAAKFQQEEREEYTIEERAKFLAETIAAQRKFRAAQRAAEIRNDAVKDSKKVAGEDTSKKEEVLKEPDSTKVEVKLEEAEQGTKKTPGKTVKIKARKKARKQTHANTDNEHDFEEDERKIESMNKEDARESSEQFQMFQRREKEVQE